MVACCDRASCIGKYLRDCKILLRTVLAVTGKTAVDVRRFINWAHCYSPLSLPHFPFEMSYIPSHISIFSPCQSSPHPPLPCTYPPKKMLQTLLTVQPTQVDQCHLLCADLSAYRLPERRKCHFSNPSPISLLIITIIILL